MRSLIKDVVTSAPNGITDVQQCLVVRVEARLRYLIIKMPDIHKMQIKLAGNGTQIARGHTIINVAFTVLEEGNLATSVRQSFGGFFSKWQKTMTILLLH